LADKYARDDMSDDEWLPEKTHYERDDRCNSNEESDFPKYTEFHVEKL
jgi:hypothetical protein